MSDLTYIPTDEGWLYCAAHKDLFNGEIVGLRPGIEDHHGPRQPVSLQGSSSQTPAQGPHPSFGSGKPVLQPRLPEAARQFGMKASMSRKGNCYDNAPMESFWGTLKNELVHHRRYRTREEAIKEITEYIEVFYNRERRQKRLGYLSPAAYVRKFYAERAAA